MRLRGHWIESAETQKITGLLESSGFKALLVGGCVRNGLLQEPVNDVDISTDARPDTVMQLASDAGIKAVPTGIDHGTVTLVDNKVPFEVTTFRKDIETDGRRAVVAFSDHIEDDARRRDFTVNALYATRDGTVIDPLNGLPDLKARRIRFIEDPALRIREDYLRILRFFRFHAWYGNRAEGMDADGLAACASLADGMASLSKERIGAEMQKLLLAPDPCTAVAAMRQTGVLTRVLAGADDTILGPLIAGEQDANAKPDAIRRLAALGGETVADALRLSRQDAKRLSLLHSLMAGLQSPEEIGYRHGAQIAQDTMLLRFAALQQPYDVACNAAAQRGAEARFPIAASDLSSDYSGKALGERLDALERLWIASGFRMTRDDLLCHGG